MDEDSTWVAFGGGKGGGEGLDLHLLILMGKTRDFHLSWAVAFVGYRQPHVRAIAKH